MLRRRALLVAAILMPSLAAAQPVQNIVLRNSFNPTGAGARGLGMGGAFIGVADDGTAASFNPAGLALLRRTELAAVGFRSSLEVNRNDALSSRNVVETTSHGRPDFLGLAVPFGLAGRNLTVQLSYQRAVDLFGTGSATTVDIVPFRDLRIGAAGNAQVVGQIAPEQSGAFNTATISAGYQATQRLLLGFSLNYWFADWTARGNTTFTISTLPNPPARSTTLRTETRTFEQEQSLRALNLNVGLLLKYPRLSIGAIARLPFSGRYALDETGTQVTVEAGRAAVPTPANVQMSSTLAWPFTGGLGIAVRPITGMTLAADYSKAYWSRATLAGVVDGALLTPQDAAVDGVQPAPSFTDRNFFDLNAASVTTTDDTSQFRAGAEYLITLPKLVIPLRAGVYRDRSPVLDLNKDQGRQIRGFTFGTGLNFTRFVFDLAFEQRKSEGVVGIQSRRGQGQSTASIENVEDRRIVASIIFRFGEDDPVKRALRALFVGPPEKSDN